MIDLKEIKEKTADLLRQTAMSVKKISVAKSEEIEFQISEISNKESAGHLLNTISTEINNKHLNKIYWFKVIDNYDLKTLYASYKKAKQDKINNRAYSRLNTISPYLYIGSSRSLIGRINQHFGYGPKGTYAMQFIHWCKDFNLKVGLTILNFDKTIDRKAFQALEDGIWEEFRPMFGRKGPK